MKRMMEIAGLATLIFISEGAFAQQQNVLSPAQQMVSKRPDGLYAKENAPNRNPIAWTFLREADVTWQQRVWRIIDLREKMNQTLYYPVTRNANRASFWDYITDAMRTKESQRLRVFQALPFDYDKSFVIELTKGEADTAIQRSTTVVDSTGTSHTAYVNIESSDVLKYLLKEDWYFDRQRSVMDVHILGICPFTKEFDDNNNEIPGGSKIMFWIYFPELRPFLSVAEVYNPHNDAERRTYDDIFWKRQFSSYIVQQSNTANRKIADYLKDPLDALLEGEKLKGDMFNLEHDMWQY